MVPALGFLLLFKESKLEYYHTILQKLPATGYLFVKELKKRGYNIIDLPVPRASYSKHFHHAFSMT